MKTLVSKGIRRAGDLAKVLFPSLAPAILRRFGIKELDEREEWDRRIKDVLACPDNARLTKVALAGKVIDGFQVMHNGIEVVVDGYYGEGITRLLAANGGCHEPQEEVVFATIVSTLPPGAVMIEAGAYWAFYSMWFCKTVSGAKTYLIEPVAANLEIGRKNYERNGCQGEFVQGFVDARTATTADGRPVIALDEFAAEHGLAHIDLVHADVQASERKMLAGCARLLTNQVVDYFFISTHSMKLHRECRDVLLKHGYRILASVSMEESYSVDRILVACSSKVMPPVLTPPTTKSRGLPC